MAIIAIILVLLITGSPQQKNANPAENLQNTESDALLSQTEREHTPASKTQTFRGGTTGGDDSVKTNSNSGTSATPHSQDGEESEIHPEEAARRNTQLRMNAEFAEWTRKRIQGYTIFDLDTAELRRIGLHLTEGGGIKEDFYEKAPSTELQEHADGSVTYTIRIKRDTTIQQTTNEDLQPAVLVTNSVGRTYKYMTSTKSAALQNANGEGDSYLHTLVPVRVLVSNFELEAAGKDFYYIYWFPATKQFLQLLPERVRRRVEELRKERELRKRLENEGNSTVPRTLAANIHPNPITQGTATVEYTLDEPGRVAVSMYDVTGERVRELAVSEQREKGTWQQSISLDGMAGGLYLLAVTTDHGQQSVQPVILKR